MFENLSLGLDIATALSVIGAAGAFIWNSIRANKKSQKERRKEIIKSYAFDVADNLYDAMIELARESNSIRDRLRDGETTQNLNPWRDLITNLYYTLVPIETIDEVYGDGRFIKLAVDLQKEMDQFISDFLKLIGPESTEQWDFDEVINRPFELARKYHVKLFRETKDYFED